jgi:hypothetical protein
MLATLRRNISRFAAQGKVLGKVTVLSPVYNFRDVTNFRQRLSFDSCRSLMFSSTALQSHSTKGHTVLNAVRHLSTSNNQSSDKEEVIIYKSTVESVFNVRLFYWLVF